MPLPRWLSRYGRPCSVTPEVWYVELTCLHCQREMGEVLLPTVYAPIPREWRAVRCAWCGGQLVRGDGIVMKPQRTKLTVADLPPPHRGRPPKWEAELRRQLREAA